ncbi:MAG: protein translocase subunit SecD [bacterium]|nr:protein translocase subunit SecD [bacterium]
MTRLKVWLALFGILVLAGVAGYLATPQGPSRVPLQFVQTLALRLGLDLKGGSQLVYEADLSQVEPQEQAESLQGARDVIERRVNAFGVSEPVVQLQGDTRIIVELPGVTDVNQAVEEIGKTPFLEFKEQSDTPIEDLDTEDPAALLQQQFVSTGLTGAQFERADVQFEQTGSPSILLTFNAEGQELFGAITKRNIGKPVAIFLDDQLLSAPTVQAEITSGQATVTGQFTFEEATELRKNLNAGALPVPVSLVSQASVGASLGQASVSQSLLAGLIGLIGVALFMVLVYRLPGLIAVFALVLYGAIIIVLFKLFGVTLTLSGLAGFFLSIGIAVDANVLIFERMREGLREGLDPASAVEDGFKKAWLSIRDSNLSSLISVVIMYSFTTSLVRGFALTLGIGVLVSMFSAITVSRTLLRAMIKVGFGRWPWLLGIRAKEVAHG